MKQERCDYTPYKGYPPPTIPDIKKCVVNLQKNSKFNEYSKVTNTTIKKHERRKGGRPTGYCYSCTTDTVTNIVENKKDTSSSANEEKLNEDCAKRQRDTYNKQADLYNNAAMKHDNNEFARCEKQREKHEKLLGAKLESRKQDLKKLQDVDAHYKQSITRLAGQHFGDADQKCQAKRFLYNATLNMALDQIDALKARLDAHDQTTAAEMAALKQATLDKQVAQCESVKQRWASSFKHIEDKRTRHLGKMAKFQKNSEKQVAQREANLKTIGTDWKAQQAEMKKERDEIRVLNKKLVDQEFAEAKLLKKQNNHAIQVADLLFANGAEKATFSRTKQALNIVRNAMMQVTTALSDLVVMFTEYSEKVRLQKLQVKTLISDLKDINDEDSMLQTNTKKLVDVFFDNLRSTYEASLGWIVISKMGFRATQQLGNIKMYSTSDNLSDLHKIFTNVVNKNAEALDKKLQSLSCKQKTVEIFQPGQRKRRMASFRNLLQNPKCQIGG